MKMAKQEVTLIDSMGDDLSVVNAARVSFDRQSNYDFNWDTDEEELPAADAKLISYLAKHNHWSPFAHCFASFRIKAPFFIARQLFKHQVGLNPNEVSRRYVSSEPEFMQLRWRWAAPSVKQGSGGEVDELTQSKADAIMEELIGHSLQAYDDLLELNICGEQARAALLMDTMTEWIWSGSLFAFARVCNQRKGNGAQKEAGEVADMIYHHLRMLFPVSIAALVNEEQRGA